MIEFRVPGRANALAVGSLLVLSVLPGGVSSVARAEEPLTYNRDIRPILAENCFACHGADSAARKAELRLDQREAAIDYGAITEGEPDESELIARLITDDPELIMPPAETKKTLTDAEKEKLTRWIKQGAEYEPHWSFILPQKAELPAVEQESWIKNPIDRFVLAQLEANGLSPASEANPHTLFRRLHLDITGLPPSPEDVDQFASDYSQRRDAALSEWIDKLMQKPTWGEHRARYWLDAARYGDTHGLHFDNYREMWPYRDWVIRAFNANQPFDQFTVDQLAGDLLPNPTVDEYFDARSLARTVVRDKHVLPLIRFHQFIVGDDLDCTIGPRLDHMNREHLPIQADIPASLLVPLIRTGDESSVSIVPSRFDPGPIAKRLILFEVALLIQIDNRPVLDHRSRTKLTVGNPLEIARRLECCRPIATVRNFVAGPFVERKVEKKPLGGILIVVGIG